MLSDAINQEQYFKRITGDSENVHRQNTFLLGNNFYYFSILGANFLACNYLILVMLDCEWEMPSAQYLYK